MSDPYRDELAALREENARLRRALRRRRSGSAVGIGVAAASFTFVAIQVLVPLLNAPRDGAFLAGAFGLAVVALVDVVCLAAILSRARDGGDAPHDPT
jgi:hypothetical protein